MTRWRVAVHTLVALVVGTVAVAPWPWRRRRSAFWAPARARSERPELLAVWRRRVPGDRSGHGQGVPGRGLHHRKRMRLERPVVEHRHTRRHRHALFPR